MDHQSDMAVGCGGEVAESSYDCVLTVESVKTVVAVRYSHHELHIVYDDVSDVVNISPVFYRLQYNEISLNACRYKNYKPIIEIVLDRDFNFLTRRNQSLQYCVFSVITLMQQSTYLHDCS